MWPPIVITKSGAYCSKSSICIDSVILNVLINFEDLAIEKSS